MYGVYSFRYIIVLYIYIYIYLKLLHSSLFHTLAEITFDVVKIVEL